MFWTEKVRRLSAELYGNDVGAQTARAIEALAADYEARIPKRDFGALSETDSILISYPDQVRTSGGIGLAELTSFAEAHLSGVVNAIHILPFYPWSSDDGFSVLDFRSVEPRYGSWADLQRLHAHFHLMLDAEINHASAQGEWFHLFLQGRQPYRDYFIRVLGNPDLSGVVRPRTTPLVHHFRMESGEVGVWTTFGPDQVDLNYRSPALLLEMLDVLLFYAQHDASFLRLDAVAYIWKQIGTSCINLPETHKVVRLIRAVLGHVAPHVRLITETNVAQRENLSYFGDGTNEAHLVYNFPLPPLVLHTFWQQNAAALTSWLSSLSLPSDQATFLNFLASHDGIGLNPARGIVADSEISRIVQQCLERGGLVSHKTGANGQSAPYELNMNYLDALDALGPEVDGERRLERFITAHAIMLSLRGVPAIYFHSLFGSRGWREGVLATGRARSVNRQKLDRHQLELELADPASFRRQVFDRLSRLLRERAKHAAFSPAADQFVLPTDGPILAVLRQPTSPNASILCLHNVSPEAREFRLGDALPGWDLTHAPMDLIGGQGVEGKEPREIRLAPYQSMWLVRGGSRDQS